MRKHILELESGLLLDKRRPVPFDLRAVLATES
jgi:hypothetical protein